MHASSPSILSALSAASAGAVVAPAFDAELVSRLEKSGPRDSCHTCYASYPSAERFNTNFTYRDYLQAVASLRTRGSVKPLSLSLHIPFCNPVCQEGTCKAPLATERDKAVVYLSYLKREVEMQGRLFAGMNHVEQLHVGGGTPSCLSDAQVQELMTHVRRCFQFAADDVGEYVSAVDMRTVSPQRVHNLRRQGFNHISLVMHESDPAHNVQAIMDTAREANFRTVTIELIVGPSEPETGSMAPTLATLATLIAAGPDRVVLTDAAGADTRLARLDRCIATLGAAGYVHIGMQQFARPDDGLAVAQVQGRLHRNFQGYSTHVEMDLVACGVSAIGAVAGTYSQNVKTLDAYYDLIDRNELPIERGLRLSMDDALRRTIIQMLMCQCELSISAIEQAYQISFATYFTAELVQLEALARDGLVTLEPDWINVSARGRLLIRHVCMVFDHYLGSGASGARHSRSI